MFCICAIIATSSPRRIKTCQLPRRIGCNRDHQMQRSRPNSLISASYRLERLPKPDRQADN